MVDPQILLESTNQWKSSAASRDAAKATITKAEADCSPSRPTLAKAKVDVSVAQADLAVADERGEAARGVGRLPHAHRPLRRRDRGPQRQHRSTSCCPSSGDPTAMQRSPHLSPCGIAAPIYVVDRTDIVRIFVDIPEQDANYVHIGTKATVLAKAYRDEPIPGTVTRTSWASTSRAGRFAPRSTCPTPSSQLLPGMYAYAKVIIERPSVRALAAGRPDL